MMYQLKGSEFTELLTREFSPGLALGESAGKLDGVFACQTANLRTSDFDILRLNASFESELQVNHFVDTSHVSLHFQLAGSSNATISGLDGDRPMRRGQFNVLNCVDAVSSFLFPRQQRYSYVCVGLRPAFFTGMLERLGDQYRPLLQRSLEGGGFSLFDQGAVIGTAQLEILRSLQEPPISDSLKVEYLRYKVSELVLLSLDGHLKEKEDKFSGPSLSDQEKLIGAKAYLETNFLLPLSLDGIARKFLLNEFKLKKGFKQLFGTTVFGYIHQLRMGHAAMLLESGGLCTGEIGMIVGYSSDSAFIRAYRLFYGCPPGKLK